MIIYFVNFPDAIPDFLLHLGFIDDIGVLAFIMGQLKVEIDDYKKFKISKKQGKIMIDKYKGTLLGLAIGDALGTTLEFLEKEDLDGKLHTEIIGLGKLNLNKGDWTDDTSMALCLAESLISCQSFDAYDQMNKYVKWYKEGYMTPNGKCVDIGMGTLRALSFYQITKNPYLFGDENSLGNGSIMRLAPIPMFFYPNIEDTLKYSSLSSKMTHPGELCLQSCKALALIIFNAFEGKNKEDMLDIIDPEIYGITDFEVCHILKGSYKEKSEDDIKNSGFVLDTLEAALWAFYTTDSFEDALIKAVNLCGDADTIGAVCGQIAGAYYGVDNIPERWLSVLTAREMIKEKAQELYEISIKKTSNSEYKR